VVYKALPLDDPKQRRPDISYAQEQLGWAPTIFIDEGLQRTIAYFKQEN
jgi:UDP-glucuronate decarboxylase